MYLINITAEDRDKIKHIRHIAYGVSRQENATPITLTLYEIIQVTYPHPDAVEYAVISQPEFRHIITLEESSKEAAPLRLMREVQGTLREMFRNTLALHEPRQLST